MVGWRKVLSWIENDEAETQAQEEAYQPSEALLERFKQTWWAEFVSKYNVDCPVTFGGMGRRGISARVLPFQIVEQGYVQSRALFYCLNSAQAQAISEAITKVNMDCVMTTISPTVKIIVEESSFSRYLSIQEIATELGKTSADIQTLFQNEEPMGIWKE